MPVMPAECRLRVFVIALVATGLAACGAEPSGGGGGADEQAQGGSTQEQTSASDASAAVESCDDIAVPGHEATDVRVQGVSCARAEELAAAAVGEGRSRYASAGFTCEPSDAGGGDTNYICTRGDARVTFRYGAA